MSALVLRKKDPQVPPAAVRFTAATTEAEVEWVLGKLALTADVPPYWLRRLPEDPETGRAATVLLSVLTRHGYCGVPLGYYVVRDEDVEVLTPEEFGARYTVADTWSALPPKVYA